MRGPLQDVKVIDLSRALAGPYCTMMLGDLGADVVKVEMPGRGDDSRGWGPPFQGEDSSYFLSVNRNKRGMTLDLKNEQGKGILTRLLMQADVLVENFSPHTMNRLGFPYERVRTLNPKIVYCSISGYGQDGPAYDKPAYDQVLQGMGGLMSITGPEGGPLTRVGVAIADLVGGMFAAYAVVSALYHQQRSGQGQYIDLSLIGGQVALLTYQAASYLATGEIPVPTGNRHPLLAPTGSFRTSDGYVNLSAGNDAMWRRFCSSLGLSDMAEDPRFVHNADRLHNLTEMAALIEQRLSNMTTQEVLDTLDGADVPAGPIRNLKQVFEDPQLRHLGLFANVLHPSAGEIVVTGLPYRFSETPGGVEKPPPLLGEHTEEVLSQMLGLSAAEIADLRRQGAI